MREVSVKIRRAAGNVVAVAGIIGALGLAACGGGDQHLDPNSVGGKILRGTAEDTKPIDKEKFATQPNCPTLLVRPGTQTYVIYDSGKKNDPSAIRFQATLTRSARDCRWGDAGKVAIKVGVAGRVLSGPRGGAGDVTLPLRVAVVEPMGAGKEDRVLYSQLHEVPATITEENPSVLWARVFDDIAVENATGLKILIGFDDSGRK